MKSITITERITYRFEFPDGKLPFEVDAKGEPIELEDGTTTTEEWFTGMTNPYAEADYAAIEDREITIEEEEGASPQSRLEYLRGEIEAERISYGEIAELQSLAEFIEPGDTLLRQWAGIPETSDKERNQTK